MRKITGHDANTLYAMKVLKKATLKGLSRVDVFFDDKTVMIVTRHLRSDVFVQCAIGSELRWSEICSLKLTIRLS